MAAENLWLPDTFTEEFVDVDQVPAGLRACVNSEGPSDTISHYGWSASETWTSSISPLMNRASHSPLALSSKPVAVRHRSSFYMMNLLVNRWLSACHQCLQFLSAGRR